MNPRGSASDHESSGQLALPKHPLFYDLLQRFQIFDQVGGLLAAETEIHEAVVVLHHVAESCEPPVVLEATFGVRP